MLPIVDAHIHCHEMSSQLANHFSGDYILVCVGEDPPSSFSIVNLSKNYRNINPCIGIHPWNIHKYSVEDLRRLLEWGVNNGVKCLGEIGLDKRFVAETFNKQLELFDLMLKYAKEYDLVLNLHSAGAWREVFDKVYKMGVPRAFFHWYTGPLDVLRDIVDAGYYIGANPAWKVQEKHLNILKNASLENILTESDAPYEYRGLKLDPAMIRETISILTKIHGLEEGRVEDIIYKNYRKLFNR